MDWMEDWLVATVRRSECDECLYFGSLCKDGVDNGLPQVAGSGNL